MATVPAQVAPEVAPAGAAPGRFQQINATPADAGPGIGAGLQTLGQGALQAADFFGQVAADDAANQYQEQVNALMYGKPGAMVKGPDGQEVPDTGYMGLKGRAALDARPDVERKMQEALKALQGGLKTPKSQLQFDNFSRRFKAITDAQVGNHARSQANVYAAGVNKAQGALALEEIGANPEDPAKMAEALERLKSARIKQAQLEGGGPELIDYAVRSSLRDGLAAQLTAIGAKDPVRALSILEKNREVAGSLYDNLYGQFRARADLQMGQEYADDIVGRQLPLQAGDDTLSTLRHFEGFITRAKWDMNHHRVGYGSDTVTREDGRIEKVTENTVVTKEDAERDLIRRATLSQNAVRRAVGDEAWGALDNRTKASLTSIAYNYGDNGIPKAVIEAAKTGDKTKIAEAILSLRGHNDGINRRRREIEAANVLNERGSMPDQAEVLKRIDSNPDLSPQAKAAATARANHIFAAQHNQQVAQKAEFEGRVQDSTAEALQTGGTSKPVPYEDFVRQYGQSAGTVKYRDYQADLQFAADRQSFETMPEGQIQARIDSLMPEPGVEGFAHRMQQVERLRKYAIDLEKQRRDDPGGAVSRQAPVKAALAQYDPRNPATFKPVALARQAAQEALGIEKPYQSPITKAEALKLTIPMATMLPGQEKETITRVAKQFTDMFGDQAEQAFSYAMRARKMDTETAQIAGRLAMKMSKGEVISSADAAALDDARAMDAAEMAMGSSRPGAPPLPPRPPRATPRVIGNPEDMDDPMAAAGGDIAARNIPPAAIRFLLENPGQAADFDKKYGQGRARKIIEQYGRPMNMNVGGGGGG